MADVLQTTLVKELATRHEMDAGQLVSVVKQRCFKDGAASDAQLMLLLTIAKKYELNPLIREVHAFINQGKLEVTIGIDGWIKIVTRHAQFDGYQQDPILNDNGMLTGITVRMFRKDWKHAGEYTAWMDEWMVTGKGGAKTNWEQYPRHRLFAKAFQECARFTFGITEVIDTDDAERIAAADTASDVIITPPVEQPKAIEHTPAMPMQDFRQVQPESQPAQRETKKRKSRATDGAAVADVKDAGGENSGGDGQQGGVNESPTTYPTPSAPVAAESMTLGEFIARHNVPERRINLALAKFGAASIMELTDEQKAQVLAVFERSYQGGN